MRRRELIARAGGWAAVAWAPAWLLGTSAALAFDSTKIGQWGSFILDDFQPILAESAQLKREVTAALAGRGGRTFETISDGHENGRPTSSETHLTWQWTTADDPA